MTSSMKGESIPCVDIVCITEFGKREGKAQSLQGGCESREHLHRLISGHSAATVESTL